MDLRPCVVLDKDEDQHNEEQDDNERCGIDAAAAGLDRVNALGKLMDLIVRKGAQLRKGLLGRKSVVREALPDHLGFKRLLYRSHIRRTIGYTRILSRLGTKGEVHRFRRAGGGGRCDQRNGKIDR
jgi:hypothetical protein